MKHLHNSNWRPLLILGFLLGLAIYFQSFLIVNIFEPISVLFWALWRIISSVHQNYYWTILILMCSILLIRFISLKTNASGPAYREELSPPNRVEDWQRLIKNALDGTGETEDVRGGFKRLLLSINQLSQTRPITVEETLLPETVRRFLFPAKKTHDYRFQILLFTPKWFRRWAIKLFQINNTAIEETLAWMESMMEISNDE